MLKLKLQYFGHLMWRADSWKRPWCWERLRAGEEGDDTGWDGWMASPTQWTGVWANSGRVEDRGAWRAQSMGSRRVGHGLVTEQRLTLSGLHWDGVRSVIWQRWMCFKSYQLQVDGWIRSWATAAADLQCSLKGVQSGDQEWGALYSGKNWPNRSSDI